MDIILDSLTKKYSKKLALDNFTATLSPGIYGLLGANGAGKTTLVNILTGIIPASAGDIYVDGTNVKKLGNQFLSQIGYLPQYPQFYRDFSVLEFLRYMGSLKGIPKHKLDSNIDLLLHSVNLSECRHLKIGALSGGMRQRVGIVQAVLGDPRLLILDEPTAGLDPQERIRFRNLISKFSKNRIVLLATHIVSDVEFIANTIIILKEGKLIQMDSPDTLISNLSGFVWEISVPNDECIAQYDSFLISNIRREQSSITIRLLSNTKPSMSAISVKPNLEDVFLWNFGEAENGLSV